MRPYSPAESYESELEEVNPSSDSTAAKLSTNALPSSSRCREERGEDEDDGGETEEALLSPVGVSGPALLKKRGGTMAERAAVEGARVRVVTVAELDSFANTLCL